VANPKQWRERDEPEEDHRTHDPSQPAEVPPAALAGDPDAPRPEAGVNLLLRTSRS
jgi:hypothetical protein